jgi:hypothetical protein
VRDVVLEHHPPDLDGRRVEGVEDEHQCRSSVPKVCSDFPKRIKTPARGIYDSGSDVAADPMYPKAERLQQGDEYVGAAPSVAQA